ncbi:MULTISPECIES: hypothetical protein [Halorussus]|uniref:hypothetical protein n=1 Tax=Halorussus TaxID=1070314 RepID=UPI0013B37022|nr:MULTISPECIES: hypothetical protein [Halorussus]NHN59976.1 hypothetical protein [Halorussus sp. JP-T4]
MVGASVAGAVESMSDDVVGVSAVIAGLAFLAIGYAAGSVLAGESVESQTRLIPVVVGSVVSLSLYAHADEE